MKQATLVYSSRRKPNYQKQERPLVYTQIDGRDYILASKMIEAIFRKKPVLIKKAPKS